MHWHHRIGGVTVAVATVGWGVVMNTAPAVARTAAPPAACFSPPIATGTGAGATALVAGDFFNHHNGTLDVVTGNSGRFGTGPGTISVLKGKGDGTFDYTGDVSIPERVESPSAMVTGDFNHDGNLDVAIAVYGGRVSILLGNGNGTFQPAVTYSVPDGPISTAAGDLDGHGFLDLATANAGSSVSVLMNKEDGTGTFNAAVSYPLPHYSSGSIAIGDVNGDGKLDIVATDPDGVEVFSGNGDGTFNPTPRAFSSGQPSAPTGIALADANRDRKLDIFLSGTTGNYALLLNTGNVNGNATFKPSTILMGQFAAGVAVGDLNGDGIPDIEAGGPIHPAGGSGVAIGNGDGTFQTEVSYGYTAQWANLADINGDGRLDIAGIDNDKVVVLLNCTPFIPPVPSVPRSSPGHNRTLPPPVPQSSGSPGPHSHSLQPRVMVSSNSSASARATLKPIEDVLKGATSRFLSGLLQAI